MKFPRRLNGIGTGDMSANVDVGDEPDSQMFGVCGGRIIPAIKYTWKTKCPIFKAIVAGFRGKVA